MRASRIKSVSYLKANAAEVLNELREIREPLVITQNGEAAAVLQDVISYKNTSRRSLCSRSWPSGPGT